MLNRNALLIILALFAIFVSNNSVANASSVVLSDSIKTEILTLEAAGKISEADSLRRVETARAELTAKQAKAQKELAAKRANAEKELYSAWDKEVRPLTYDEVWSWVEKDTVNFAAKIKFLSKRYGIMTDTTKNYTYQLIELTSTIEFRSEIRTEAKKEVEQALKTLLDPNSALMKKISEIDERSKVNATHIETVETCVETVEARVETVERNLELVREEFNKLGFNQNAMINIMTNKHSKEVKKSGIKKCQQIEFDE